MLGVGLGTVVAAYACAAGTAGLCLPVAASATIWAGNVGLFVLGDQVEKLEEQVDNNPDLDLLGCTYRPAWWFSQIMGSFPLYNLAYSFLRVVGNDTLFIPDAFTAVAADAAAEKALRDARLPTSASTYLGVTTEHAASGSIETPSAVGSPACACCPPEGLASTGIHAPGTLYQLGKATTGKYTIQLTRIGYGPCGTDPLGRCWYSFGFDIPMLPESARYSLAVTFYRNGRELASQTATGSVSDWVGGITWTPWGPSEIPFEPPDSAFVVVRDFVNHKTFSDWYAPEYMPNVCSWKH